MAQKVVDEITIRIRNAEVKLTQKKENNRSQEELILTATLP